jgi:hypothetical protein
VSELGPKARALIEAGRELDEPDADDRARVKARLGALLGAAALGGAASTASAAAGKSVLAQAGAAQLTESSAAGAASTSAGPVAVASKGLVGAAAGQGASAAVMGAATGASVKAGGALAALGLKAVAVLGAVVSTVAVGTTFFAPHLVQPRAAESIAPAASHVVVVSQPAAAIDRAAPGPQSAVAQTPMQGLVAPEPSVAPARAGTSAPLAEAKRRRAPSNARAPSLPAQAESANTPSVNEPSPASAVLPVASALQSSEAAPPPAQALSNEEPTSLQPSATPQTRDVEMPLLAPLQVAQSAADEHSVRAPTQVGAPSRPSALSAELVLLAQAQRALRQGELPRALALLDEHAAEHPHGALREERLAARAVALCRMGQLDDGRVAAERLAKQAPRSPHLPWVKKACEP